MSGLLVSICLLLGLTVPNFDAERAAFLEMTPAERRAKFTDAEWRGRIGKGYSKIRWRETREGEVSRWRQMDGVVNVRDLGGLKGLDGKMIVMGRVFRSGQFNKSASYRSVTNAQKKVVREYYGSCTPTMTAEQVAAARKSFGIRTDLDLRGVEQCRGMKGSPLGDGIKFVNVPASNYAGIFNGVGAKRMADALRVFADAGNYPIIFHCVKGADRTGSLAFILHSLLGVSAEDRLLDWELTAFSNANPKFAHADRYDKLTEGLAKFPGATDAEKAAAYAKKIGLTDAEIEKIRDILLR